MKKMMQRLFGKLTSEVPSSIRAEAFLHEEEERQMAEVRDRLQRVREELAAIDRRKQPREAIVP